MEMSERWQTDDFSNVRVWPNVQAYEAARSVMEKKAINSGVAVQIDGRKVKTVQDAFDQALAGCQRRGITPVAFATYDTSKVVVPDGLALIQVEMALQPGVAMVGTFTEV